MMMFRVFLGWVALLLLSAFTFQSEEEILWGQRAIEWSDFKGKPQGYTKYAASLSSGLHIEGKFVTRDSVIYVVKALMHPQQSWVVNPTDTILNHERGHFDITEIFARKLRKEMSQKRLTTANINREVSKLFRQINEQRDQMQDQYDDETNHSIHYAKQLAWEKKIQAELLALEDYKNLEVKLKVGH